MLNGALHSIGQSPLFYVQTLQVWHLRNYFVDPAWLDTYQYVSCIGLQCVDALERHQLVCMYQLKPATTGQGQGNLSFGVTTVTSEPLY
jgi:hypothetical protein